MKLKQEDLAAFSGSDKLYRHWTGNLYYTEGVKYLAEKGEAHWLLDCLAAAQLDERILRRPLLQEIQFWTLEVVKGERAILYCKEDSDRPAAYTQEIPFTDFPLPEVKIWIEMGTVPGPLGTLRSSFIAMLPNER